MRQETAKRIHDIYNTLLHDEKYKDIAMRFNQAVDALQKYGDSFTQEQWDAIDTYRNTFMEFSNVAMALALNDEP